MKKFLNERGLNLNLTKTKIRHTLHKIGDAESAGTNYLGFRIKHFKSTHRSSKKGGPKTGKIHLNYGIKLLIYPEPSKINNHFYKIKKLLKYHRKKNQKNLDQTSCTYNSRLDQLFQIFTFKHYENGVRS